jgi:hypothetical protein
VSVQTGGGPKRLSATERFIAPAYIRERRGTSDAVLHFRAIRKQKCIDRHEAKIEARQPWLRRADMVERFTPPSPSRIDVPSYWQKVKAWFRQLINRKKAQPVRGKDAPWLRSVPQEQYQMPRLPKMPRKGFRN